MTINKTDVITKNNKKAKRQRRAISLKSDIKLKRVVHINDQTTMIFENHKAKTFLMQRISSL